jgi:tetratricopeptide (TPR) repeat protein
MVLSLLAGCPRDRSPEGFVDPRAPFEAGVALLQQERPDYEAAYLKFVEAEAAGAGPRASYDAGWVAQRLGRDEDALRHYRQAADQAPGYEAAVSALLPLLAPVAPDEVVQRVQALVQREPELGPMLVEVLVEAGRHEDALAEARAQLRQRPDQRDIYEALARMYTLAGQPALAQLCADKALLLDPESVDALNELGLLALQQGDQAAAAERFRAALAVSPEAPAPNANLGWLALVAGDFARAEPLLGQAAAADPSDVQLQYAQALARRGTGDVEGALELLEQILQQDPAHTQAAQTLAELQAQRRVRPKPAPSGKEKRLLLQAAEALERTRTALAGHQGCLLPETSERISLVLDQIAEVVVMDDLQLAEELVSMLEQTEAELGAAVTAQCP